MGAEDETKPFESDRDGHCDFSKVFGEVFRHEMCTKQRGNGFAAMFDEGGFVLTLM